MDKVLVPSNVKEKTPSLYTVPSAKKDGKVTQTDDGKYSYMPAAQGGYTSSGKERALQRHLDDAEAALQEKEHQLAQDQDDMISLREKMKRLEMDLRTAKRESMNEKETNSRLKDQLKESMHKIHLHQIEAESLIKQIDLADAKTREKEDDLRLQAQEYDSKLKLQLERLMVRRAKNEERETFELKRKHRIELDELQAKLDETAEEVDYYKTKCDKLEIENSSLRSGKNDNKRQKELENEVEMLRLELEEVKKTGGVGGGMDKASANAELRSFRKDLSGDEQI